MFRFINAFMNFQQGVCWLLTWGSATNYPKEHLQTNLKRSLKQLYMEPFKTTPLTQEHEKFLSVGCLRCPTPHKKTHPLQPMEPEAPSLVPWAPIEFFGRALCLSGALGAPTGTPQRAMMLSSLVAPGAQTRSDAKESKKRVPNSSFALSFAELHNRHSFRHLG